MPQRLLGTIAAAAIAVVPGGATTLTILGVGVPATMVLAGCGGEVEDDDRDDENEVDDD